MHWLRNIKLYSHVSIAVDGYSKNYSHVSIQVQCDIYMHVIWTVVYTFVYLYTGVLNFEIVKHTSSLLVYGTHTYFDIKQSYVYVRLLDDDWNIHALVGVWQLKVWLLHLCHLEVTDFL